MRVVVSGASGLLGTALVSALRADRVEVRRLVRRAAREPDELEWHPGQGELSPATLADVDALVHLSGAGLGDQRWSPAYKATLVDSRVRSTELVAGALAAANPQAVLVTASAVGYYGDTGEAVVDESSPRGDGFLAELVERWEGAASAAVAAGMRVAHARFGVVISHRGGALGRMVPLFRLGGGATLGSGQQWWSWVSLEDAVRSVLFLLDSELRGPVNVTTPNPVRNVELTRVLARALNRPAPWRVPAFALRAALGEFADEGLLWSQRVAPTRLHEAGFSFVWTELDDLIRTELRRR